MTLTEMKERLAQVENAIFMEQMADFMNWREYYALRNEQYELERKISSLEKKS